MTTVLDPTADPKSILSPSDDTPTDLGVEPSAPPVPDTGRPGWSVPARIAIFALTAVLYTWDLARVGMGNTFYAAAVKSGTESWKAFFFGSLDPGSFITVDKPPAALWVMELSGRIFGFNAYSMLLPEALAGLVSVMVLYHVVRRWAGEPAAVLASISLALTPVAVVIFRYNDPDAFLVLLLVLAAWGVWAAIESGRTRGLVVAGTLLGLAFLTKTLDAFIVVPAFAAAYLWAGPPRLRRRIGQLAWAGLALVVSSSWWIAIVELWPAGSRPYIGGSTDNSELNLIFGYNGFSRIFGSSGAGAAPGGTGGSGTSSAFGGGEGVFRMFDNALGGQISWLIPLALVGLIGGLWLRGRAPRSDRGRAGYVLFGGWLLMVMAVYDDAKGIFHPYYTAIMAPAVAALAGAGAVALWKLGRRTRRWAWALPVAVIGSAVWADVLLGRTTGYYPWLGTTIVVAAVVASVGLLLVLLGVVRAPAVAVVAGVVAAASLLAGPIAYAGTTVSTATNGIATAGPSTAGSGGFPGGAGGLPGGAGGASGLPGGTNGHGAPGSGGFPGGLPGGAPPTGTSSGSGGLPAGAPSGGFPGGGFPGSGTAGRAGAALGGAGLGRTGGGQGLTVNSKLVSFLEAHQGTAEYLVAVENSQTAAPYILDTGKPVIAMGGFTGTDPAPTLAQFEALVKAGKVHFAYLGGAGGGGMGGSSSTLSSIQRWLTKHATVVPTSEYGGSSGGTLYYVTPASVTS